MSLLWVVMFFSVSSMVEVARALYSTIMMLPLLIGATKVAFHHLNVAVVNPTIEIAMPLATRACATTIYLVVVAAIFKITFL